MIPQNYQNKIPVENQRGEFQLTNATSMKTESSQQVVNS